MTKDTSSSLLDRLRARDLDVVQTSYGRNRRVVLARRDDIETALAAGYSLRRIFTLLHDDGSLTTDYSSFRRAARNLGIDGQPRKAKLAAISSASAPKKPAVVFERPVGGSSEFVYNPRPNRKDLL